MVLTPLKITDQLLLLISNLKLFPRCVGLFSGTLLRATCVGLLSGKTGFLNQNTSLEWFIDPHLFGLKLSSFILLYLIILLGLRSSFINFWNDKWCSTTSLTNIAGLSDGASIPDTVSQFWIDCNWNIPLSLQQMSHFFNHIMVREEQDIPNCILDESGHFTLKYDRTFFLEPGLPYGLGKFIWSSYIPPSYKSTYSE